MRRHHAPSEWRRVLLQAVRQPHRLEADPHNHRILRLPAGQRLLRAAILLDGRTARLSHPVGRHHCHRGPVPIPGPRQHRLRRAAPRPPEDAGCRVRCRHGRLADRGPRLHANVQ